MMNCYGVPLSLGITLSKLAIRYRIGDVTMLLSKTYARSNVLLNMRAFAWLAIQNQALIGIMLQKLKLVEPRTALCVEPVTR